MSDRPAPNPPARALRFQRRVDARPATLYWSLETYEGKPFVSARVWTDGPGDRAFPTKQGITIRRGEIDAVISTLTEMRAEMARAGERRA